uniref:Uncharacterized protein n=1 Tax=Anguilla anguilla TaxID=7936 RepID=A0A0E9PL17_ANGAN
MHLQQCRMDLDFPLTLSVEYGFSSLIWSVIHNKHCALAIFEHWF